MPDEKYLLDNKWTMDRGRWIWNGDTSIGYSLEMAVQRQRSHDEAEAKTPLWLRERTGAPSIQ